MSESKSTLLKGSPRKETDGKKCMANKPATTRRVNRKVYNNLFFMNFPLKPGAKIAKGECNTKPKACF